MIPPPEKSQHNNFTVLRLALALLVVLGHFAILPADADAHGLFSYGTFAVETFFVISGYLIFASFDKLPVIGGFYIRRLFRIYPLFMAVVIVQGLAMAAIAGGILENSTGLARYLSLNLIMANFMAHDIGGVLSGLHNDGINPSLWTLKIELAFYFLVPLLWYFTRRFSWGFLLLVYAASTAYALVTQHYGLESLAKQLPGQMRFFTVGMALYYYRKSFSFPLVPTLAATLALFTLCQFYHDAPAVLWLNPLCSGLVMMLVAFRLPHIPLSRDISYGVYLVHGPLIQLSLLFGIFRDTYSYLAVLLAVVLALAFVAERFIELPGIEMGKRLARLWALRCSSKEA